MKIRNILTGLCGGCLMILWQSPVQAQMYQADVDFQAVDESMWGPGGAGVLEIDYFIGPTWGDNCTGGAKFTILNSACATDFDRDDPLADSFDLTESVTTPGFTLVPEICVWGLGCTPAVNVPPVNLGTYGAAASGETAGQIGFDLDIDATTGDVDVDYGGSVEFEWLDGRDIVGDTITIDTSFTEGTTAMSTNFPEASLSLEFVFDVLFDLDFDICFVDCSSLDLPPVGFRETEPLLNISTADLEVSEDVFGGLATITAQFPDINTSTAVTNGAGNLVSTDADTIFNFGVDLDAIAAALLGLPPTAFGDSFSALGATAYYTLLDVMVSAGVDIRQVFTFDPNLLVTLLADDGQSVTGNVGDGLTFDKFGAGQTLVTPTFNLMNLFTSTTYLDITAGFMLEALKAGLIIDFGGIIDDLDESFGPVINEGAQTTLGSIEVFSTSYRMDFDPVTAAAFVVTVPEPGTLALFGIGLMAIGATARRRRRMPPTA